MRGTRARGHLAELQLNRLVLADRLAEGLARLRVARRERECAVGDADSARRDVDAAEREALRDLIEALAPAPPIR
jgi:hypothetical protein